MHITVEIKSGVTVVKITGEFEGSSILDTQDELFACIDFAKTDELYLDMKEISYIDSSGISVLLQMAKRAAENDLRFALTNVVDSVRKVIEVTHVDKVLRIVKSK